MGERERRRSRAGLTERDRFWLRHIEASARSRTPATIYAAEHGLSLGAFYEAKRDFFRARLAGSRFELLDSRGTYFQLARYAAISDEPDVAFVERLTRDTGVAAIPVSAFFADAHDDRVIRFCFAKNEATLAAACERLCRV